MKRRNFLKLLSSIPLIGIPVRALAKTVDPNRHAGTKTWSDGSQTRITREEFYAGSDDPYEDVENIPWGYPMIVSGEEMNTDFGKITLNRGVKWLG